MSFQLKFACPSPMPNFSKRTLPLQVKEVLEAAFQRFPRLGLIEPTPASARKKEDCGVKLRTWSTNSVNQLLFHNEAMQCCQVSIREISKRRALWHDRHQQQPTLPPGQGEAPLAAGLPGSQAAPAAPAVPAPSTPPTGRDGVGSAA